MPRIHCKNSILFILFFAPGAFATAQELSPGNPPAKHISWQYFKASFDDDFFNIAGKGTDQYYTGGWQLDAFYRRDDNKVPFVDRLLVHLPASRDQFFYGVFRRIYTPANIESSEIVKGDRPYASVLTVQHGLISASPELKECLTTEVGVGAIGPMTFGGAIQKWVHNKLCAQTPNGWDNQVRNDLLLDYRLNYEKQVARPVAAMELLGNIDCEAGTLVDNLGVGFTLGIGKFNETFVKDNLQTMNSGANTDRFLVHFYVHPTLRLVMYNATLEGGFFSTMDPYVIDKNDMNYIYLQYDYGIVMVYRRMGLSFSQRTRTAEFKTAKISQVGNITLTMPLGKK